MLQKIQGVLKSPLGERKRTESKKSIFVASSSGGIFFDSSTRLSRTVKKALLGQLTLISPLSQHVKKVVHFLSKLFEKAFLGHSEIKVLTDR